LIDDLDALGVLLVLPPGAAEVLELVLLLPHAARARAPAKATAATFKALRKGFSFRARPGSGARRIGSTYICRDRTIPASSVLFGIPL